MAANKKICLVVPSLGAGGLERVMSELASYFCTKDNVEVFLVILTKQERFYTVCEKVTVIEPDFNHQDYSRIVFTFKIMKYLRETVKKINPDTVLCFGEKYNSFTILALLFTNYRVFVSDRSSPLASLNFTHRICRKILYRQASGIISQTSKSKSVLTKTIGHKNIVVVPNPIKTFPDRLDNQRENIILNIGRLIRSKNQDKLMDIFSEIDNKDWKLLFLGNGKEKEYYKDYAVKLGIADRVSFIEATHELHKYLSKSKIFAFTSSSEGFPNVLGEAMFFPVASISYNCVAGPDDLIRDGENGFLVAMDDNKSYIQKLGMLMSDGSLRDRFETQAMKDKTSFSIECVGDQYFDAITKK